MPKSVFALAWLVLGAAVLAGCSDPGPPGAGFTNGPEPVDAPEKPAVRTDVPPPDIPNKDDAAGQAGGPDVAKPAPSPGPDVSKKSP